jgi:tRNA threonylcarbamoyladenosine biosynthesis protein TsaB
MTRLAFDTSTAACAVAIGPVGGQRFETLPHPERMFEQPAHTTELLPAITELLQSAGIGFADLEGVAVGIGPGAFTGLRIGVASARAIATASGIPLTGVSSLAALEANVSATHDRPVLPVIDARRKEFFFRVDGKDAVGPAEDLLAAARLQGNALAIGDGAIKLAEALTEAGVLVPERDDPRHVVSALKMLELAEAIEPTPVDLVVPNYIREPDAKVSARESWLVGSSKP